AVGRGVRAGGSVGADSMAGEFALRRQRPRPADVRPARAHARGGGAAGLLDTRAAGDAGGSVGRAPARGEVVVPPLGGCELRRCVTNSLETLFIESRDSATSKGRERP